MKNEVVLITGASSGLGLEIARQMHADSYIVYAAARSLPDKLAARQSRDEYSTLRLDVTDEAAARTATETVIAREGRLDIVVLAAGYGLAGAIEDTSLSEAKAQLETNFFGAVTMLTPAVAQMRRQKSGLIVFLGSVAGVLPVPFQAFYSAGKSALAALCLCLADELKPFGVNCMLVQPGDTNTGFTDARLLTEASDKSSAYADRCGRSVKKMAADEAAGMPAAKSASLIVKKIKKRRPPLVYTPGFDYKLIVALQGLLPVRLVRKIVAAIYAS